MLYYYYTILDWTHFVCTMYGRSIDQLIYYYYTRSNSVIIRRYLHNTSHKNYDRTDPLNVVGDHDDLWEPNNSVIERS